MRLALLAAIALLSACASTAERDREGKVEVVWMRVDDPQRFATLGHELMHCFEGNWHDRWGRMEKRSYAVRSIDPAAE